MLLRSSSAPNLKSCISQSSPGSDPVHLVRHIRSISLPTSPSIRTPRSSSDSNLKLLSTPKKKTGRSNLGYQPGAVKGKVKASSPKIVSSVGGGRGEREGFGDWGQERGKRGRSMDKYYQTMIKKYPGNALILSNYAKFLKEVGGDLVKAEEYCGRAILAKASDGEVLSMYGDLIWNNHRDDVRAQSYFDQAVQTSPDDCHVLASYARFMWDAEDDEEKNDEIGQKSESQYSLKNSSQSSFFLAYPPETAAY